MAGMGPQNLQQHQLQVVQEAYERSAAIHANAGLGVPTPAQILVLDAQNVGLRYKATPPQYLYVMRQLEGRQCNNLIDYPKSLHFDPTAMVAALRACNILNVDEANAIMDLLVRTVLGSMSLEKKDHVLSKEQACACFWSLLKVHLASPAVVMPNPPETFVERQLHATITVNFFPELATALAAEKRHSTDLAAMRSSLLGEMERLVSEKVAAKTKGLEVQLSTAKAELKRRRGTSPEDRGTKHQKPTEEMTCLKWIQGKCNNPNCKQKHVCAHEFLKFLNKRLSLKVTPDKLKALASD